MRCTATVQIDNGTGKTQEFPVVSNMDMNALRLSVECMLHLYAGSTGKTEAIHTTTTYQDGTVENEDWLCYKGRLIPDSVMAKLRRC